MTAKIFKPFVCAFIIISLCSAFALQPPPQTETTDITVDTVTAVNEIRW
ncbi:MAG: hypothetical protein ACLR56_09915 [Oscillospiraceae bacterium]